MVVVYNRRGHKHADLTSQKETESMKSVSLEFVAIERQHSVSKISSSRSHSPEILAACKGISSEGAKGEALLRGSSTDSGEQIRKVWPMYCDMEDMHEV